MHKCHISAKACLDLNFNAVLIGKYLNFHEIAPQFTYQYQ